MSSGNFTTCYRMGCGNPCVPKKGAIDACGKHGGETAEVWALHHVTDGWLSDAGAGGSYSSDVDDAKWWPSNADAVLELERSDILSPMTRSASERAEFRLLRLK